MWSMKITGIGIYQGIEKIEVDKVRQGLHQDFLCPGREPLYSGHPAGPDPEVCKCGRKEAEAEPVWAPRSGTGPRTKVRERSGRLPKDLVALYAARQEQDGFVYGPDTVWQKEFEEMFPFEETEDQLTAIEAIEAGHGEPQDHGPPDLRRCGIWKDGDCYPGGL